MMKETSTVKLYGRTTNSSRNSLNETYFWKILNKSLFSIFSFFLKNNISVTKFSWLPKRLPKIFFILVTFFLHELAIFILFSIVLSIISILGYQVTKENKNNYTPTKIKKCVCIKLYLEKKSL